jgi:hypothetical protein
VKELRPISELPRRLQSLARRTLGYQYVQICTQILTQILPTLLTASTPIPDQVRLWGSSCLKLLCQRLDMRVEAKLNLTASAPSLNFEGRRGTSRIAGCLYHGMHLKPSLTGLKYPSIRKAMVLVAGRCNPQSPLTSTSASKRCGAGLRWLVYNK